MTKRLGADGPSVLPTDKWWCPDAPLEHTSAGMENPDAAAVPARDEGAHAAARQHVQGVGEPRSGTMLPEIARP